MGSHRDVTARKGERSEARCTAARAGGRMARPAPRAQAHKGLHQKDRPPASHLLPPVHTHAGGRGPREHDGDGGIPLRQDSLATRSWRAPLEAETERSGGPLGVEAEPRKAPGHRQRPGRAILSVPRPYPRPPFGPPPGRISPLPPRPVRRPPLRTDSPPDPPQLASRRPHGLRGRVERRTLRPEDSVNRLLMASSHRVCLFFDWVFFYIEQHD